VAGAVGAVSGGLAAISGNRLLGVGAGAAAVVAGSAAAKVARRVDRGRADGMDAEATIARAEAVMVDAAAVRHEARVATMASAAQVQEALRAKQEAEAIMARAAESSAATDAELARGPESVFDSETGLLDERVFVVSFDRKVAAARRHLRPLCLVLLDTSAGLPTHPSERSRVLHRFGSLVRQTLRDADIACRLGPSAFGLILEDTPEAGGVWAAERLQIAMACHGGTPTRLVAAVAAYPNHGLAAQEILQRAQDALRRAQSISGDDGMGPVEVAISDPA
jgi:diguanylate cyclase (GGDEF)-like protein